MSGVLKFLRKLIERREHRNQWIYIVCAVLIVLVGLLGVGMEGDWMVLLVPYLPLAAICGLQFFRPALLGWFVLTALFLSDTIAVAVNLHNGPLDEFVVFLLVGAIPTAALLWSWPKPVLRVSAPSR
jgi:hypothetical protein